VGLSICSAAATIVIAKKESYAKRGQRRSSDKPAKDVAKFGADTQMKRPAQPEEIAPAFVYFASEVDSSYVTGEILTLLGGDTTAS
jgi:NAD(P)-dependent dehydrogenase (short-subunit alcohol dehydrogenase family)